ncbi:MAG: hypothetical protein HQL63_01070 [Magnetococcales bacterium]|nr:hypothetical protein [Magnetococcales bacterium]
MNQKRAAMIAAFGVLLAIVAPGHARAESCSKATAEQAVLAASEIVERLGVEAAKQVITKEDARFRCGEFSVKVINHRGTWVIDPEDGSNVGHKVAALQDGAAINFMNSLIQAAIRNRGSMGSYFATDTEHGKEISKALYHIDVPKRKVVVYGAFILG